MEMKSMALPSGALGLVWHSYCALPKAKTMNLPALLSFTERRFPIL
jgi:hypothetical protein